MDRINEIRKTSGTRAGERNYINCAASHPFVKIKGPRCLDLVLRGGGEFHPVQQKDHDHEKKRSVGSGTNAANVQMGKKTLQHYENALSPVV